MAGLHRQSAALALSLLLAAPAAPAAAPTRDEQTNLVLEDGRILPATIRVRDDAMPRRRPAIMLFGGFRNAAKVLDRVQTDRDVVWATFNYPFDPPRKFHFPSSLRYAPEAQAAVSGSFDGVVKLHEALKKRGDVDPRRITVVGASAGSPFATVGAARAGIPGVILVQGFGETREVFRNVLARKYRKKYGDWVEHPAGWLACWLTWYLEVPDIAAHARQLKEGQKVLLFTTSQDDFIPKESTELLWTALDESKAQHERIDLEGLHLGVGDDRARIAEIMERAMVWMEKNGLL